MFSDRRVWNVRRALPAVVALFAAVAGPAVAQNIKPPESYEPTEGNGVNLATGSASASTGVIAIGPQGGGLSYSASYDNGVQAWRHSTWGGIERQPEDPNTPLPGYTVTVMGQSVLFARLGATGPFEAVDGYGALSVDGSGLYTFTALDGTTATFSGPSLIGYEANEGVIRKVVRPSGETIDFHYLDEGSGPTRTKYPRAVISSLGWQIRFDYPGGAGSRDAFTVTALNTAIDACLPTTATCTFSRAWPSLTFARPSTDLRTVTDASGAVQRFGTTGGILTGVARATQSTGWSRTYVWTGPWPGRVASVSDGRGTWTYDIPERPSVIYETESSVTDPQGAVTTYAFEWEAAPGVNSVRPVLQSITNGEGETTEVSQDGGGVHWIVYPEGNRVDVNRNGRGDIEAVVTTPKPGSGLSPTTVTATYADCSTPIRCGRPTSVTDARGIVTDYTYAPHGGVLTETRPAAAPGQDRPQTRYTYQSLSAWARTGPGGALQAQPAVVVPTQVSTCATGTAPSCVGTAQEVRTTTTYQAGSASVGSNLLPLSVTSGAGDGSLTAVTATTWDADGDAVTVDGPLPGAADTTWYAHDVMRRNTGVIGPDPDGAGPLPFPATRTVFNADGQPTEVQQGSATAQSTAALSAMTVLSKVTTLYDAQARKARDTQILGTGTIGVTQYAYDSEGRPTCTAVRMNPANFAAPPTDACAQGAAGTYGPDRISRNSYDDADRLEKVEMGVGTDLLQVSRLQDYTLNGKVAWVEDANGNRSGYVYDGFDRLARLHFPMPTLGAHAWNPNDYEAYTYDPADNVLSRRTRDDKLIYFSYDALNRETVKTLPTAGTADDVFTTYDLLGRRLSATYVAPDSSANGIVWTWDALGRPLTETAYGRTLISTFDLAGRRTRLTWPSPFSGYADFSWDLAGRMTTAGEGPTAGASATYAYDALGRRTSLTRTGAATTTWSYVANSRDWSMTHDLAGGTTNDVAYAFLFNPAGQAVSRDITNPAYQFAMPTQAATAYTPDGLNQYDAVGSVTFGHDLNGNLTSDGVRTYNYDVENRLISVYEGSTLRVNIAYDPLGRIKRTATSTLVEQYLWDGDRLVGTIDGSNVPTGRWLHGPGPDEPLAQLLSPRRWLLADHQGSITAETDGSGALVGTPYTYDPYGRPDATHQFAGARFRYTGQTAIVPTVPLWHYKARAYDPGIGRFLQTDPTGYVESLNLYEYVGNDPLNWMDPQGLWRSEEAVDGSSEAQTDEDPLTAGCAAGGAVGAAAGGVGAIPGCAVGATVTLVVTVGCALFCDELLEAGEGLVGSILNNDNGSAESELPEFPVGTQDGRGGRSRSRGQMSGPLAPENGGTGDPDRDFETLGGGSSRPPPAGSTLPPGTRIAPNGVRIRPGSRDSGPRIDVPGSGSRPPETLHYPPRR